MVILLVVSALLIFDGFTSFFTMNRLDRGAEIISKLQTIEQKGEMSDDLEEAYSNLRNQLNAALSSKPWTVRLSLPRFDVPHSRLLKFFAGIVPFGLLSLIAIGDIFRRKQGAASAFLGIWIIAFIFGIINLLMPVFWWPWFNLAIVPIMTSLFVLTIIAIIAVNQTKKEKEQNSISKQTPNNIG